MWEIFKQNNLPARIKELRKRLDTLRTKDKVKEEESKKEKRVSEQIMTEADKFDKKDVPPEKKEQAEEKLREDAEEKAKEEKKGVDEVLEILETEAANHKFKIEFSELPGAPFYDVKLWGQQIRIIINASHRFYQDIYSQQDTRGKTALELLLFVLGKCEIESDGDKELFYQSERFDWSRNLETRLKILDKKDPISDKQAFAEEKI